MGRKKKTYLDLFLDNSEAGKKKRGNYFGDAEEQAILLFNDPLQSHAKKNTLYEDTIKDAFSSIVSGVLEMPKFRTLPKGMDREQLIEHTNFRLIEKIGKFTPGMIGKSGQPVKAFSYFSTIAKNYILEQKVRFEKILKNKADVEKSIDLSILSEDTLKMMSNYDKTDILLDDYEATFNGTRDTIIAAIEAIIDAESAKAKPDNDLIKIGAVLKYLLTKWNKIEFMKKNEFMRILTLYTGLKQQQVSFLFKKFKVAVFKKLKPEGVTKVNKKVVDIDEDFEEDLEMDFPEDFDDEAEEPAEEEIKEIKYNVNSMEDFDAMEASVYNRTVKLTMKKRPVKVKDPI